MQKKWFVVISVLLLIGMIGGAVLRFGEMTYLSSGGQRGWSLGAAVYSLFGWDTEDYRTDIGQRMNARLLLEDDSGVKVSPYVSYSHGFGNRFGTHSGHRSGGHLLFWLAVLGIGYYIYRQRKQRSTTAEA